MAKAEAYSISAFTKTTKKQTSSEYLKVTIVKMWSVTAWLNGVKLNNGQTPARKSVEISRKT